MSLIFLLIFLWFPPSFIQTHSWSDPDLTPMAFHTVIYFIIVTVSTVGYGDYSPASDAGQWTIAILVCVGLIFVPQESRKIINLMSMTTK